MGIKKTANPVSLLGERGKGSDNAIISNPNEQIKSLHENTDGYIALFRKGDGQPLQRHYKLDEIRQHVSEWITYDSYLSMNTFYTPKRLITNLREIRTAFVDIDCYNNGFTPEQVEARLKADFFGVEIPTPNMMIHSGRGLNLIWFLDPISGLAVERWDKLQQAILSKVESLGADKKATDAARVFRLAGSVNSKNNAVVYYELLHEYRYGFSEIVEEYFPDILKSVQQPKKKAKKAAPRTAGGVKRLFNEYTLLKARMHDIEALSEIRGGVMDGSREYALFLYRYWALAENDNKEKASRLMLELNSSFTQPLPEREALADTKSAERYHASEEPFRITNKKVIEWLQITKEEQQQLKTIISSSEKRRRNTEHQRTKRRSNGVLERDEYDAARNAQKADRAQQLAKLMHEYPAATQSELAQLMGVSIDTIKRILGTKK